MKNLLTLLCLALVCTASAAVRTGKSATPQAEYAATVLAKRLGTAADRYTITLTTRTDGADESFAITRRGRKIAIAGTGAGVIYGANRLAEHYATTGNLDIADVADAPEMRLRGACVGLQKTEYLPGHTVYEYPYTPQNFPWFYDRQQWLDYLDMLAAANMNAVYLWNGHPFASLVKLNDYPFAPEVDDATMALNEQTFAFLTTEAERRGIRVVQMFYNIIVSRPFADHYGMKTQDRNRPIVPVIADYTRKSIAAFIERYPNVGLLVCLGEAMRGGDDDVQWMTQTIIPGIKDGLAAARRTDMPPIILRSHDTDAERVLSEALPLYPNIFTMTKYTGESLTTYQPGGPWGETQRHLAAVAPVHISNVHILANLEPWRWASPAFIHKAVGAMHTVHGARGLHLYPQASYWDWPYTADRATPRLRQVERDWMWYDAWGRYAWRNTDRDMQTDACYWRARLAAHFGTDTATAARIITALDESGEIAPKLIRRFGITEGNRQTLLLGMRITQLTNPMKYTVYPGFYESCGPQGEKLIEWAEREYRHQEHHGELPLDIADQCRRHGIRATQALQGLDGRITRNADEFRRLATDMECYRLYAAAFQQKVLAAERVLRFKWARDTTALTTALAYMERSDSLWARLATVADAAYLYANSMQTAQRRIPVGGDRGTMKTWGELLPIYKEETACLRANLQAMQQSDKAETATPRVAALRPATATVLTADSATTVTLAQGAHLFTDRPEVVDTLAPELVGLQALQLNYEAMKRRGESLTITCRKPAVLYVGYFKDDQDKFARAPKLEIDASANDYGQAEPVLSYALRFDRTLPMVSVHAYHFTAGTHRLLLPKGVLLVLGTADTTPATRDVALNGADGSDVDWLFMK